MAAPGSAPHVLYVAWGFPPCRGGGVYRALATVNGLAAKGFRVTVLTATRETFIKFTGADTSLEALVDPRVEVVRVPFSWPHLEMDVREWSPLRALAPRVWRRARLRLDVMDFPEKSYGPWKKPLLAAADKIHASDPVDLVVASANPNVDFAVADHLHSTANVPYVMDYRDAWMLDVFDGGLLHPEGSKVSKLERRFVDNASEIWFVNEPIRVWHQKRYPASADKMYVVANGYDPDLAPSSQPHSPDPDAPLRFGYIGTVSGKVPLAEFAAGWRLARGRSEELAGATAEIWGYLGYYGSPSKDLVDLIEDHADDGIVYRGPLPKGQVKDVYETFDATLLILGAGRYVTSGKVFEYTAAALPIVSVHSPDNAAKDVLEGYPLWFPLTDLEPETVARALEEAASAARNAPAEVRSACAEFSRQYSRELQLDPRLDAMADLLGWQSPTEPPTESPTAAPTDSLTSSPTDSPSAGTEVTA